MKEVLAQTVVTLSEYSSPMAEQHGPVTLIRSVKTRDAEITQAYAPNEFEMAKSIGMSRSLSQPEGNRDLMAIEIVGTEEIVVIETDALIAALEFLLGVDEETE